MERQVATVILRFYNEEYLLPWWLSHHTRIFDRGILIDHGSTDRSLEICKEFAPDWPVYTSPLEFFGAEEVDQELMGVERQLPGWKMVLNITEFFCVRDVSQYLWALEGHGVNAAMVPSAIMADTLDEESNPLTYAEPLVTQRRLGFFEHESPLNHNNGVVVRSRLLHRHADGAYTPGRHRTLHKDVLVYPPGAILLTYYYSPYTPAMHKRKAQIGPTIPVTDPEKGMGTHHLWSDDVQQAVWREEAAKGYDLRRHPMYAGIFGEWPALQ